jgi:hypothetical protein
LERGGGRTDQLTIKPSTLLDKFTDACLCLLVLGCRGRCLACAGCLLVIGHGALYESDNRIHAEMEEVVREATYVVGDARRSCVDRVALLPRKSLAVPVTGTTTLGLPAL